MGRHSCCYKQKLRKGLWSPEEDEKLLNYITKHGHGCWSSVPKLAGLQRCGKSCRLRWINYLRPDLKRGAFSQQEENLIIELHSVLGNSSKITSNNDHSSNLTPTPPTQEFFLDSPNIGLSVNPNTSICFNPNSSSSEMISEFNSSMTPSILQSMSSSMFQTSIRVKPSVSLPSDNPSVGSCDVSGVQNWEAVSFSNNGSSSHGSSSSIELQNNNNFFESNTFSWGLADCGKPGEEAQLRSLENDPEDIKWSEYLSTPFLLGTAIQNQTSQPMYSEVKPETNFITEGSSASWQQNHNHHHQQASQPSDIYAKDLQRLAVAFGQTL
ncbi:hypothetical protein GH714_006561 [Hevea brasiliensis]|uniref:Uncharacterized protein n=1 Tax=Hevea brasiliensis TaxID=3981 RepID=A0A6A6NG16_HEVBR|nr:hypothetical protein GH714_006561 [Hevea brasiliensis]